MVEHRDIQFERRGAAYHVSFERKEIGAWKDPECSAARYLLDKSLASRDDILRTYRGDKPGMKGFVGWFADHQVREEAAGGLRFIQWRPHGLATVAPEAQKTASDGLEAE